MDGDDAAVLFCQALLLVWTVCFYLYTGCKSLRTWAKNFRLSTALQCLHAFWQWCLHGSPDNDRVAMYLAERRVQRMRIVAMAMKIGQWFNGLAVVFNIVTGRPRWYSAWMDIATILVQLITICFNVWPALVSRMPNVLYSTAMALVALHASPAVESVDPLVANAMFVVRFSLSMAILDMRAIIFWNAVTGVVIWCQFVFILKDQQCAAMHLGEFAVAVQEIITSILIITICYSFKQGVVAEIREKLGASAYRRECGAVSVLLRSMSDVVVKLDSNLHVLGDCPTLATMLLRESVRNTEFESYLFADDDRQQLQDCIASTAETENDSIVPWRVDLRDAMGTCVMAEVFHTQLEDVAGKIFHMIGIRELQEAEAEVEAEIEVDVNTLPQLQGRGANAATDAENGGGRQRGEGPNVAIRDDEQPRDGSLAGHHGEQTTGETSQPSSSHQAGRGDVETTSVVDSTIGSIASGTSRKDYKMLILGLERTTARSQRTSMLQLLTSWNFQVPAIGCCSYHASINEARNTIKSLARARCNPFHLNCKKWQCWGCGILAHSPHDAVYNPFTRTCNLCSEEPTALGKVAL